jgi:hypothetical protein
MAELIDVQQYKQHVNEYIDESQKGGFSFDLCTRNNTIQSQLNAGSSSLSESSGGSVLPSAWKTGTANKQTNKAIMRIRTKIVSSSHANFDRRLEIKFTVRWHSAIIISNNKHVQPEDSYHSVGVT